MFLYGGGIFGCFDLCLCYIEKGIQISEQCLNSLFSAWFSKRKGVARVQSALVYEISWILMIQDFLLLVGADVGVNLRGGDGAVSEDMLYVADVHVFLQQLCGKGMAEHMGRQMLGDFQGFLIAGNQQAHRLLREWVSELVDEEKAAGFDFFLKHGAVGIEDFQHIRVADLQDALL